MTIRTRIICASICVALSFFSLYGVASDTPSPNSLSIHQEAISPLKAISILARTRKQPIGIVIGADDSLCSERPHIDVTASSLKAAIDSTLKGTTYSVTQVGTVFDILPQQTTSTETLLLSKQMGAFSPPRGPMHTIGILFDGWLGTVLHPGRGFAFDALSQTTDVQIDFKSSNQDKVMDVLNSLVSKGGGGVWFMQPQRRLLAHDETSDLTPLVEVYSYADNDQDINFLSCSR